MKIKFRFTRTDIKISYSAISYEIKCATFSKFLLPPIAKVVRNVLKDEKARNCRTKKKKDTHTHAHTHTSLYSFRFSQSLTFPGFAILPHEKRHRFLGFECSRVRARISRVTPCRLPDPCLESFRGPSRSVPTLRDLIFSAHASSSFFYFTAEKSRLYRAIRSSNLNVTPGHRCASWLIRLLEVNRQENVTTVFFLDFC